VVKDRAAAWQRLEKVTAPTLAGKLGRSTPCVQTGVCCDCKSPERICRYYTVIASQMPADKDRIHVIIVDEDLGI
ncbi:MAG TPA: LUD domain-containing protein, partial [Bacillota bacterium]|nr:LUD domain-containing protein [Bacillota bacterium]